MDEDTQKPLEQEAKQVQFPEDGSELHGSDGVEVVVHDKDENGNVVGWHKEPKEA